MSSVAPSTPASIEEVDVVIPCWDKAVETLPQAIDSVRQQGCVRTVVVVDNASELPVEAVVAAPDVRVVRSDVRLTVGSARNLGLQHVDTSWVAFVDADDTVPAGAFDELATRREEGLVAVTGKVLSWLADPSVVEPYPWPRPYAFPLSGHRWAFALLCAFQITFTATCTLYRTDTMRAAGGFGVESDFGEDWVATAAIACAGRVLMTDIVCRHYRQNPDGLRNSHEDAAEHGLVAAAAVRRRLHDNRNLSIGARVIAAVVGPAQDAFAIRQARRRRARAA